jgi:hypothetical protein
MPAIVASIAMATGRSSGDENAATTAPILPLPPLQLPQSQGYLASSLAVYRQLDWTTSTHET